MPRNATLIIHLKQVHRSIYDAMNIILDMVLIRRYFTWKRLVLIIFCEVSFSSKLNLKYIHKKTKSTTTFLFRQANGIKSFVSESISEK